MNRRQFLAAAPLAVAGCRDPRPAAPPQAGADERQAHLAMLANCRVAANAVRTTPKPAVDVVAQYPELKPLVKVAVRLHPRFGDEPPAASSKLGGQFLWPADEDWPRCPEFHVPMQPVLQLRAEDAPNGFPYRPNTDLFQLLWTPRPTKAGPPHAVAVWRKIPSTGGHVGSPPADAVDWGYVPVPCRFFPEKVAELPPVSLMPAQMRAKVEAGRWPPDYAARLSTAPGTKAGGWPGHADAVTCRTCVRPMDYLLTVASSEWTPTTRERWKPTEDADADGHRRAAGFAFGRPDAAVQVYVCRRCGKWPLRAVVVHPTA